MMQIGLLLRRMRLVSRLPLKLTIANKTKAEAA
jgi:hypothetical protein